MAAKVMLKYRGTRVDCLPLVALALLTTAIVSDVLGGVLRYALFKVGVVELVYLPKMAIVIAGCLSLLSLKQNAVTLILGTVIALYAVLSLFMGLTASQVAFGATLYVPIIFGAFVWPYIERQPARLVAVCVAALLVSCVGLLWNLLGTVPWAGFEYEVAGESVEGTREWSTFGLLRPSGFARLSAGAAIQIFIFVCLVAPFLLGKSRFLGVACALLGLVFIGLTTTKSVIAATIVMFGLMLSCSPFIRSAVLLVTLAASILLPLSTLWISYGIDKGNLLASLLLASFEDRLTNTWPNILNALFRESIPGIGRGLGGVGSGEKLFGSLMAQGGHFGFSDNLPLYMYGNLGVFGLLLVLLQCIAALKLVGDQRKLHQGLGFAVGGLLVIGLATDVIESLMSSIFIGMALRAGFSYKWANISSYSYK